MTLFSDLAPFFSPQPTPPFSTALTANEGANEIGNSNHGSSKIKGRSSDMHKVKNGRVKKSSQVGSPKHNRWNIPFLSKLFGQERDDEEENDTGNHNSVSQTESEAQGESRKKNHRAEAQSRRPSKTKSRQVKPLSPDFKDWSSEETWLYMKLQNRGCEPLMPMLWQWDFPNIPDVLFTNNRKRWLIENRNTTLTEATTEFQILVDNGPRCRDALHQKRRPEPSLRKGIERYQRWSLRDARMQHKIRPELISIIAAKPGESIGSCVKRMTKALQALDRKWRDKFAQCDLEDTDTSAARPTEAPILYGMLIKFSVVSILTYDPSQPSRPIKTVANLSHTLDGHDVWHAYAISIVCVRVRDFLMQLEEDGHLSDNTAEDSDPDA